MPAQQGEEYRVIAPKADEGARLPKVNGVEVAFNAYTSTFRKPTGETLTVIDRVGDVVKASENVDYPRGTSDEYRNLKWIDEHPERFELIETAEEEPE